MLCSAEQIHICWVSAKQMLDCSKKFQKVTAWGPSKGGALGTLCRWNGVASLLLCVTWSWILHIFSDFFAILIQIRIQSIVGIGAVGTT